MYKINSVYCLVASPHPAKVERGLGRQVALWSPQHRSRKLKARSLSAAVLHRSRLAGLTPGPARPARVTVPGVRASVFTRRPRAAGGWWRQRWDSAAAARRGRNAFRRENVFTLYSQVEKAGASFRVYTLAFCVTFMAVKA